MCVMPVLTAIALELWDHFDREEKRRLFKTIRQRTGYASSFRLDQLRLFDMKGKLIWRHPCRNSLLFLSKIHEVQAVICTFTSGFSAIVHA